MPTEINPLLEPATLSAEQQKSKVLLETPAQLFDIIYNTWRFNTELLWNDENPQSILDAMGTSAHDLLELSNQIIAFLESLKPGCTTETLACVKPFTINQDGTITVNP